MEMVFGIIAIVLVIVLVVMIGVYGSVKDERDEALDEVNTLKSTVRHKENVLEWTQRDLEKLQAEKETEWKRLQDEAKEDAENNVEYELERARATEESLICANKDLHDVIAEMRNLFAKTQQQTASDTVKALVPWSKEDKIEA